MSEVSHHRPEVLQSLVIFALALILMVAGAMLFSRANAPTAATIPCMPVVAPSR